MQATPDSPVRDAKKKSPIEQARIIIVRRIWAAITAKPVPRQIRDAGWGTGRNYYLDDIDIDIYT